MENGEIVARRLQHRHRAAAAIDADRLARLDLVRHAGEACDGREAELAGDDCAVR